MTVAKHRARYVGIGVPSKSEQDQGLLQIGRRASE